MRTALARSLYQLAALSAGEERESLLAEAEASPYDPLGLRVPWEELRKRGEAS